MEVGSDDLTELLRACLVALRLPAHAETYQQRRLPFWSVSDATGRINRLLQVLPGGSASETFLPELGERGLDRSLRDRAALAETLIAGLELARGGTASLEQDTTWNLIQVT